MMSAADSELLRLNDSRFRHGCVTFFTALILTGPAFGAQPAKVSRAVENLSTMSDALEEITAQVLHCVVRITGETFLSDQEPYDERGQLNSNPASSSEVEGSGILVSSDGYIVTNAHVVMGGHRIRAFIYRTDTQTEVKPAKLVGIDQTSDLAVLRVQAEDLPFIDLQRAVQAKQGEISLAIGDPYGMDRSVTMGIVSAVNRQIKPDDPRMWIQTDAAVNPGNSGGPLVDVRGHLLGINTMNYSETGGNQGIALAIPSLTVRDVVRALIEHGRMDRVTLGIAPLAFNAGFAEALHLEMSSGILIEDVDLGGPADRAGLKPGDAILSVDGRNASTTVELSELLNGLKPQIPVNIDVLRAGKRQTFRIVPVLGESDPLPLAAQVNEGKNLVRRLEILGLSLNKRTTLVVGPTRYPRGVVVAARSSTLHVSGDALQVRDIIYQVNGQEVDNLEKLHEVLKEIPGGAPLVLQVERGGRLLYVPLGSARD
jgi:serine protease Do